MNTHLCRRLLIVAFGLVLLFCSPSVHALASEGAMAWGQQEVAKGLDDQVEQILAAMSTFRTSTTVVHK